MIEEVDISDRLNEIKSEIEKVSHEGVRNSLLVKVSKSHEASKGKSGDLQSIVFDYDANGNRVSKTYAGPPSQVVTEKYGYDFEDRLSVVQKYIGNDNNKNPKLNLKDETLMSYDGLGRRLIKTSNNTTLNYVYDNLDVVNILNTKNSQYENLFRDDQMNIVSTITSNGNAFWFETDALGSTTGITKEDLGGSKNIRYSDFGSIIPDNTPNGDNNAFSIPHESFSYTGQEWDSTTGLYEFYSRAYDPEVGVWLQLDRFDGRLNDPASLNYYKYVANNPTNLVDYYGYDWFSDWQSDLEMRVGDWSDDLSMRIETAVNDPGSIAQSYLGWQIGVWESLLDTGVNILEFATLFSPVGLAIRFHGYNTGQGDIVYNAFRDFENTRETIARDGTRELAEQLGLNPDYVNAGRESGFTGWKVAEVAISIYGIVKSAPSILSWCKNLFKGGGGDALRIGSNLDNYNSIKSKIIDWLGDGAKNKPTPKGNAQFMSADGNKIIRFDYVEEARPHINVQEFTRDSAGKVLDEVNYHIYLDELK